MLQQHEQATYHDRRGKTVFTTQPGPALGFDSTGLDDVVLGLIDEHHSMSFVRRKRGRVVLVHNQRVAGTSRVQQRELQRFTSPDELEDALSPAGWARWTEALVWREQDMEFDWAAIRERLAAELTIWIAAPSGATLRRDRKLERLAAELLAELAQLSLARVSDAALIDSLQPTLIAMQDSISRLLPSVQPPSTAAPSKERPMSSPSPSPSAPTDHAAEIVFDKGMDQWWSGDRRGAAKLFRRAIKLDPEHADAHNHLGIVDLEARKLKAAERHFHKAIEGGERHLERDGAEIPWGFMENRPYLRGLANLALVFLEQEKWAEALVIHKRVLKLNPNDNQGVRWLVGVEHLRVGDDEGAVKAFSKVMDEEVGCAFGLALAKLRVGAPSAEIGEALLTGFAANRYLAPMLLGEPWERLDAFHGSNIAEPDWANDVILAQADLWHGLPKAAKVLRFWWAAPAVATWRRELDDAMIRLADMPPSGERSAVVATWMDLRSYKKVRALCLAVRSAS